MKNITKEELSVLKNKLLTKKNIESDLFNSNIILNGMKELKLSKKAKAILAASLLMLNLGLVGCGDDAKEEPINESVTEEEIVEEENEQGNEEIENEPEEEIVEESKQFVARDYIDYDAGTFSLAHGHQARDIFMAETFISETTGEEVSVEDLKEKYGEYWRFVFVNHLDRDTIQRLFYQFLIAMTAAYDESFAYVHGLPNAPEETPPHLDMFWYLKPHKDLTPETYNELFYNNPNKISAEVTQGLFSGRHEFSELRIYGVFSHNNNVDWELLSNSMNDIDGDILAQRALLAVDLTFFDIKREMLENLGVEYIPMEEFPELLHEYYEDVDEFLNNVNNGHSYFNGARTKKL